MEETSLNEQQVTRREKLGELRALGIDPYPARLPAERTHTAAEAIAAFQAGELAPDQRVTLAGRLVAVRVMGKASFAHIEDGSGRVQIYVKRDRVGDEAYDVLWKRLIDLGRFHRRDRHHVCHAHRRDHLRSAAALLCWPRPSIPCPTSGMG